MMKFHTLKFLRFSLRSILLVTIFFCPKNWAAQKAQVIADKAVIYADAEMTNPIGYVARGKQIVVGNNPRNNGLVYPIKAAGKIAFIRLIDISIGRDTPPSTRIADKKYQNPHHDDPEANYVLSYLMFNSQISNTKQNSRVKNGDGLMWQGVSVKGEVRHDKFYDIQVLLNYIGTTKGDESYRLVEVGGGLGYRLKEEEKWLLRAEGQFLVIPFSTYSIKSDFRMKSYGFSLGGGLAYTYFFDEHWGIETGLSLYYTKLLGYDLPSPYQDVAPTFLGVRANIGLNYNY